MDETTATAAARLHAALAAVCPIAGVAIGDPTAKTTWRIDFAPAATPAQEQAAQQVVATFDPAAAPTIIISAAFQARFTAAEQGAVWAAAAKDTTGQIGAGLTQGLTLATVDLTSPALKTWMAALVTAGAITADRETAILTP